MKDENDPGTTDMFKAKGKGQHLTPVQRRLVESAVGIAESDPREVAYQHTVLCQTCLPYRNPGDGVRVWQRRNGCAHLEVLAGKVMHPKGYAVEVGLPYGAKPRLVLAHLNAEAVRTQSPEIEVGDSLTAFMKRVFSRARSDPNGREIRDFKDQFARLAGASIWLGVASDDGRAVTVRSNIITGFELWLPEHERQRVLSPAAVRLSHEYFDSLTRHAVPLDERAIIALSASAMGLDLYCWLAQRLHRIATGKPQPVSWAALKEQFGAGYERDRDFRRIFRKTLQEVLTQYPRAQVELDEQGLTLRHSRPPVSKSRRPTPPLG